MAVKETTPGRNMLSKRAALLAAARILAFAMTIPLPLVLVRTLNQLEFGLYKQSFQIMMTGAAVLVGSVHAIVVAAVVQGALHCLIMFVYLHKRFGRFWGAFDWPLFKAQLANALPFGIGGLAYGMQADLHNYFVSHYFDPDQFAIYAVGCFQLPLLGMLFDSVTSVLLPEVARREAKADYQGIIAVWAAAVRKLALFFLPAYALLFVVRHEFITTLFTQTYAAASPIFAI